MFDFLIKNRKTVKKEHPKMKDVIFAPKKEIIRLKEKVWKIEINPQRIKWFLKNNQRQFLIGCFFAVIGLATAYSLLISQAETTYFYPATALGGWENPQYAAGAPDMEEGADEELFNINNSAVLKNSAGQIFLGDFQGDLPEEAILQKAFLKISLAIKKEPLPSPTPDIFNPEFPLITPTPTSTPEISPSPEEEHLDDPTPTPKRDPIFMPELPIETPTPTPVLESTPELTPEIIITPSETPILEITPIPELIPSPTPIPESTPVSWWFKMFNFALAQELTPTPILILDPTPEPTPEISSSPEFIIIESPLPSETPIPETSLEPSFSPEISTPEPTNNEAESPSPSPSNENEPEPTLSEMPILEATIELTPEPTPTPTPSAEDFLEVVYTFDGVNWNLLTKINRDNWEDLDFEILDFQWDNLDSFQVSIQSLTTVDPIPEIYLDGVTLEIEFEYEVEENDEPEILENSPSPTFEAIVLEDLTIKPIKNYKPLNRKLTKNITIDPQATHSCQIKPFQADISGKSFFVGRVILQKTGNEIEELEIGSLPNGIDVVFSKNNDYVYSPATEETEIDLKINNKSNSQKGSFNIPIIYTKKGTLDSSIMCQINIINF
jgi:hypothetical protein